MLLAYGSIAQLRNHSFVILLALFAAAPASAAPLNLIALGDSLTQGYGLPPDDGLVPQLQNWLQAHGHDVTVLNAGVSGDTSAGGRSRIDWTLAGGGDAIIVELGGNDMLRGIDPAATRDNLDAILRAASAKGLPILLIGLSAPGNFGADYQTAFDAIYPDLAAKYHAMLIPNFFAPLTAGTDRAAAMKTYMQADGIHPNAAGVRIIVAVLGPQVEQLLARIGKPATN
jgi:acyl-CoA thioesterase-1